MPEVLARELREELQDAGAVPQDLTKLTEGL